MSEGGRFDLEWLSGSHGIEVEGGLLNLVVAVGGSKEEEPSSEDQRGPKFSACCWCG